MFHSEARNSLCLCFRHFLALNGADLIDFMEYLRYEPDYYTSATLSQKWILFECRHRALKR